MTRQLFKHSLRALGRQKAYVLINVLGLAVGLACSIIIGIFILHELSYDQFHEHKDRIYRVGFHGRISGQEITASFSPAPMGPTLVTEFPEVENYVRLNPWGETIIKYEENFFTENYFIEADSTFFDIFSIPLLEGDKKSVLNHPYFVVLSESTARKMFDNEDPIGKMLKIGTGTTLYQVSGIMADIPENSHFRANMIGSFMTNPRANDQMWGSNSFQTYVLLYPGARLEAAEARFDSLNIKYFGPELQRFFGITIEEFLSQGNAYNHFLQPLTKIHLQPKVTGAQKSPNDPKYLWIFGSIGLLIILIAAINFMNLSTAQATKRAKEVGIKKVSGAARESLVSQFLFETLILSFLALLVAIFIVEMTLPWFNQLLDIKLRLNLWNNLYTLPILLLVALFTGIFAGSYPAFYLSSFNPITVLKGKQGNSRSNIALRGGLTVLQFAISIILISGTMIMYRQIRFLQNKELGFDKEHILVLRRAEALRGQTASFKEELKQIPGVMSVSASTAVPGHNNNNNGYRIQGRPEDSYLLTTNWVDYDFLETYGMQLAEGRFFDPSYATDREACIINERTVRNFQLDEPLNTKFLGGAANTEGLATFSVIGVVKDFHFESLRNEIHPYILRFREDNVQWGYVSIRLAPNAAANIVDQIEKVWAGFATNDPMVYFFMDSDFEKMYMEEKRNAKLAVLFTIIAIFVASLGLYGLTAFTVQQRTKEIGVRKTFGASVSDIWMLVSKETCWLICFSTAIAWPLIYWVASNWLQNYHYRISLKPWDFLTAFLIAVIIAISTISYRTIRTASLNPSLSLRYE
jgi:putative ABC transport system permease protein